MQHHQAVHQNMMIRYFENEGCDIFLAAPTGRAAKRMTEATGFEALIGYLYLSDRMDRVLFLIKEGLDRIEESKWATKNLP